MVVRTISGVLLLLILGVTFTLGGPVLFVLDACLSVLAFLELTRAMKIPTKEKKLCALEWIGLLGISFYYVLLWGTAYWGVSKEMLLFAILLTIMIMMLIYVFQFPKIEIQKVIAAVFSFVYAPIFLSYLFQIRLMDEKGIYLVWLVFTSSWACDTCAYCVGKPFGRHKLAPVLSPKKSIEGAIGGVVGAALIGFLYAFWLVKGPVSVFENDILWAFPLISAIGGVLSQIGDLAASGIKRTYGIKDYGKLIPGHGGIMDRFDSVVVTAPLIYYLVLCLM